MLLNDPFFQSRDCQLGVRLHVRDVYKEIRKNSQAIDVTATPMRDERTVPEACVALASPPIEQTLSSMP